MPTEGFKRKLTAIFSTDVVDYSRLMGENEESTVKTLETYKGVMSNLINEHRGRVVDSPGDNLLGEFGSVVDAVQRAVSVQKELQACNASLPENRKMQFRIGINLGDVIEEKDRLYGDGVNIAARLESLADPGGICISKIVFEQIESKLPLNYRYLGKQEVKNIAKPISAHKVLMETRVIEAKKAFEKEIEAPSFSHKPSIAVLPFVNMSNDPEQEYFSDGMSEEIIGALAKLEGLKVISRTSACYFKGEHTDLRTIGEKLNVDHVLEGSLRKAGNRIRISAQLIKVSDETHIWADTYDRELKDVFAIQDEISQAVVNSLSVRLLGAKSEPLVKDYSKNTEAYELYLKGRFFDSKSVSEWGKAREYYEKTIEADPKFAHAYSKLAMTYVGYAILVSLPSKEMWSEIKTLTLNALEIDGTDADAHASLGLIKSLSEYDWIGAERDFKRAIELHPGNSQAYVQYAMYLIGVGRENEAIEKTKRALELDPFSIFYNAVMCFPFYLERQFDKAIAQSQKTLELDPNDSMALEVQALSYAAKGMYDKGIMMLQQARAGPPKTAKLGYLYGKSGKIEEAQRILDDFLNRSKKGYFSPYLIASVYASLGEKDKVFEWLEIAYEERDPNNWYIKVEPMFDDLHPDLRWTKLMEKMRLAG